VEKTNENHKLLSNVTSPISTDINDVTLADLKLANEIIIKYKQPGKFSYFSSQLDKVYQIHAEGYLGFTFQQKLH
jgi:hypothetical protein